MIKTSWRDAYKVHPAADAWPMLPKDELKALGEDIKKNGLRVPIVFYMTPTGEKTVIDGRNRLEAAQLVGVDIGSLPFSSAGHPDDMEVVSKVISLNAHRRHLTKEDKVRLIIAARDAAKLNQVTDESVSDPPPNKGGRGNVNEDKAQIVADAVEHGISKGTAARAYDKSKGKTTKPKPKTATKRQAKPVDQPDKGKSKSNGHDAITVTLPDNTIKEARSWYVWKLCELNHNERTAELEALRSAIETADVASDGVEANA